jgi:predicted alpha/beta superfamily hydrolase
MRVGFIAGWFLMIVARAAAAQPSERLVSLPNTEYREFTSKTNARPYAVFVALPDSYNAQSAKRYPVVYVTDAHVGFPLLMYIYKTLRLANEIPESVLVGVAGRDPATWLAARFLDLTPTRSIASEADLSKSFGAEVRSGDAGSFLRVLTDEIFPDVGRRYRTTDDRTYIGHSLGGLFGAYAMFQAPNAFSRLILGSPAFYWDDAVIFKQEEKYAADHHVLRANVFMTAGGSESASMIGFVKRFASTMAERKYDGLVFHSHIFDDETHTSVVPPTIARGLRTLFKQPQAQ